VKGGRPTPSVFTSFLSLAGGEVVARAVAFSATIYVARQMGPEGFGIIGFAAAVCGYVSVAISSGFDDLGAREAAREPERGREVAAGATLVRLGIAVPAYGVVALFVWLLGDDSVTSVVIMLTGLSFFSLAADTAWAHKGLEKTRLVGIAVVVGQLLYLGFVIALVRGPADVALVPVSQLLGEIGKALVLFGPLLRGGRLRPDLRKGLSIVKESFFLVLTRVAKTVIYTFDIVAIGFLLTERDVGLYSAAYRICLLLLAVGYALRIAYLPAFSRASRAGEMDDVNSLGSRSMDMALVTIIPLMVGGVIVGGSILSGLFGDEYVEGLAAFRWLLVSIGLAYIYGIIRNVLLVFDRTHIETRIMTAGALVNVGLNLVLIPRLGLVGAAMSTVTAQALILVSGFYVSHRIGVRVSGVSLTKPVVASAVMAGALFVIGPDGPIFVTVPAGGIVYGVALLLVKGVPDDAKGHLEALPFIRGLL